MRSQEVETMKVEDVECLGSALQSSGVVKRWKRVNKKVIRTEEMSGVMSSEGKKDQIANQRE